MRRLPSPATGIPALVGLLLVVFVIAGLLVHEAWSSARSGREIAQRGLQDYAAYATWSTARAGDLAIGSSLSMLFRGLSSTRVGDNEPLPALDALTGAARDLDECDCALGIPAEYFFRFDSRSGQVKTARQLTTSAEHAPSGWAAAKVGSFAPQPADHASPPIDARWLA